MMNMLICWSMEIYVFIHAFIHVFCHRNTLLACTRHCDFGDACAGLRTVEEDGEEQQSIPDISDSVVKWMAEWASEPSVFAKFVDRLHSKDGPVSCSFDCRVSMMPGWLFEDMLSSVSHKMGWRSQLQMIHDGSGSSHFTSRKGHFMYVVWILRNGISTGFRFVFVDFFGRAWGG